MAASAKPDIFKEILLRQPNKSGASSVAGNEECLSPEVVCPVHSRYALPSLTLQNNGCLSCAALNAEKKYGRGHSLRSDRQDVRQPGKSGGRGIRLPENRSFQHHNARNSCRALGTGKPGFPEARSNTFESRKKADREVEEVFEKSRAFYRHTDLQKEPAIFDGAGVNPYRRNLCNEKSSSFFRK